LTDISLYSRIPKEREGVKDGGGRKNGRNFG